MIQQVEALGAKAIAFPTIEIVEIQPDLGNFNPEQYQSIIFISSNAVENGLKYIKNAANFEKTLISAIGRRTAERLREAGINNIIQPDSGYNSESLLALNSFSENSIRNTHILIIRGEGGREFLADSLKARGAHVDYLQVYRRVIPVAADPDPLITDWSAGKINIVTVTSNESLKNLYHMLEGKGLPLLLNTPLITPGERCSQLARQLGFTNDILQAASATDDDMIIQLKNWLTRN